MYSFQNLQLRSPADLIESLLMNNQQKRCRFLDYAQCHIRIILLVLLLLLSSLYPSLFARILRSILESWDIKLNGTVVFALIWLHSLESASHTPPSYNYFLPQLHCFNVFSPPQLCEENLVLTCISYPLLSATPMSNPKHISDFLIELVCHT